MLSGGDGIRRFPKSLLALNPVKDQGYLDAARETAAMPEPAIVIRLVTAGSIIHLIVHT